MTDSAYASADKCLAILTEVIDALDYVANCGDMPAALWGVHNKMLHAHRYATCVLEELGSQPEPNLGDLLAQIERRRGQQYTVSDPSGRRPDEVMFDDPGLDASEFEPPASVPAYAQLEAVLSMAYEQASGGKGRDRHVKAEGQRFEDQPICELQRLYGNGYAFGQVGKKMEEAQRLPRDRAVAELLGGIVYLSAAIVVMEEQGE